jgi:CheY-like chemotaxis protein
MGGRSGPARERRADSEAPRASGTKLRTSGAPSLPLDEHVAALGTLAAGVACRVNDPLTSVLVNLEHVARRLRAMQAGGEPSDDGINATIASIAHALEEARRVRDAVRALMAFSGGATDERTALDPRSIFESAMQLALHDIRAHARVIAQLDAVPHVEANPARLAVAFTNVLANAAQACARKGAKCTVRVESRSDDDAWAVFEVKDDGDGIPPDVLPHVFDPYFTTKHTDASHGLGLSIAYGVVTSLGGEIALESAKDEGTTVRIRLPAAPGASRRRRVLVVDDDRAVAASIARALEADEDVTIAHDGDDAIARLAADDFDAVVCDLGMAENGAVELYAEIVRRAPELVRRVVFVNDGALAPKARALANGANNPCVDKPIDAKELRAAIARTGRG